MDKELLEIILRYLDRTIKTCEEFNLSAEKTRVAMTEALEFISNTLIKGE